MAQGHEQAEGKCADLTLAPQRGANSTPLRPSFGGLRAALAASGPRLGRSSAGGFAAPRPPRAAPLCAFAHGHPLPRSPSRRGSGHGCAGGGGGQPLAVVHARRLAPGGFRASGKFQKVGRREALGDSGACPRYRKAAVGNPAQAVGGQGAAAGCARRPRTGRGCPRATGHGRQCVRSLRRAGRVFRGENGGQPITAADGSTHHSC